MRVLDGTVLDLAHRKEITMDDEQLMREVLDVLLDDTESQLLLLDAAIQAGDMPACRRLAHYSKGACANVGAGRAAAVCRRLEQQATNGEIEACSQSLAALRDEMDALRQEVNTAFE